VWILFVYIFLKYFRYPNKRQLEFLSLKFTILKLINVFKGVPPSTTQLCFYGHLNIKGLKVNFFSLWRSSIHVCFGNSKAVLKIIVSGF
jgi:hypothetical protein